MLYSIDYFTRCIIFRFDPYWLIFNCHSPNSKQEDTNQIILDKDSIPDDLTIESVHIEDSNVLIKWNKDSGQGDSILPIQFLVNNCPLNFEPTKKESRFKTSQVKIYIFLCSILLLGILKYKFYYSVWRQIK